MSLHCNKTFKGQEVAIIIIASWKLSSNWQIISSRCYFQTDSYDVFVNGNKWNIWLWLFIHNIYFHVRDIHLEKVANQLILKHLNSFFYSGLFSL